MLVNAFSKLDIMVSTTSACSSKREKLNEVLLAMGIKDNRIEEVFAYPWVKRQQKKISNNLKINLN